MASLTKTLLCSASDPGTWTATTGAQTTGTVGVADSDTISGHTDTTCLEMSITGRSKSNTNFWTWAGTWEDLGVPAGSVVTQVTLMADRKCATYTTGASSSVGPAELRDSADTLIGALTGTQTFTGTGAWTNQPSTGAVTVPSGQQASNSTIHLRLNSALATGASNSANVKLHQGYIQLVVTYSAAAVTGSASLTATSTISAAGRQTSATGAPLTASTSLTASGSQTAAAGVALAATSTFNAAGVRVTYGAAALNATSIFAAAGSHTASTGASLAAASSITAAGTVTAGSSSSTYTDGATLTASATLHAAGIRTTYSAYTSTAHATFAASGYQTSHTGAALIGNAVLTATTTTPGTTDTPIESFAWKIYIYRKGTPVPATDECVAAFPQLFTQSGGTKTATTSFVYYDQTLKRHRAVWPGDKVAAADNAYLAAPNNFA